MADLRPLLPLLALAAASGCDFRHESRAEAQSNPGDVVACALHGEPEFAPDCTYERGEVDGQRILVIHNPDGSFRRFAQVSDGRGLIAADGADKVTVTPMEEMVQVSIAGDRYLLPANIRSHAESQ